MKKLYRITVPPYVVIAIGFCALFQQVIPIVGVILLVAGLWQAWVESRNVKWAKWSFGGYSRDMRQPFFKPRPLQYLHVAYVEVTTSNSNDDAAIAE